MMVRGLDLRSGFAVSMALFIGLLTQVKPEYFERLPDWLHTVTSDMLTVSLVVAIGLMLLFRIGIRQRGAADWDATDAAHSELSAFLGKEGKTWKLADDVIERARDAVGTLVDHLKEGAYLATPVAIKASYDNLVLSIVLVYRGRPPPLPHHGPLPCPSARRGRRVRRPRRLLSRRRRRPYQRDHDAATRLRSNSTFPPEPIRTRGTP